MAQNIKDITKLFQESKSIALLGHRNPDGDCVGSLLGLGRLLERQGKKVSYFTPTAPSRMFNFLPNFSKIKTKFDYQNYDLLVFVDLSSYDRIAPFTEDKEYFDNKKIIVFDHHPGETTKHAVALKDIKAMSCSEVIFEFAQKQRKKYLDKEIATYFYLGLMTDSGNFLFDKDHQRIFQNALALVKLGADKTLINNNILRKKSLNQMKFLEMLIKRIRVQGEILFSYYQGNELAKYGIDQEEAGYGLSVIQNIEGPRLTLMLRKVDSTVSGSLRAKDTTTGTIIDNNKIDCNTLAKYFGGGGHRGAAGFTIPAQGNFLQQIKAIVTQINKNIKK